MPTASITLYELNQQIKDLLHTSFAGTYWVIAEISELRTNRTGHCYLELIEKDEKTDQIKARSRATIWASTYQMIKAYFERSTGQHLTAGLKLLIRVSIDFQEQYGLSLNIRDIDPTYTLGDIAQKRKQIVNQLQEDGILEMNKELSLQLVPQKIAIISSPTAAGYEDFCNQLDNNSYNIKYYHKLFPATMQGEHAETSIIETLDNIFENEAHFDVVVIIRGGGSSADLLCFDSYDLAVNIAQFPLPILTGIGHDRDETVADLVAYDSLKTPTAVAEYLIAKGKAYTDSLNDLQIAFANRVKSLLQKSNTFIKTTSEKLSPIVKKQLAKQSHVLNNIGKELTFQSKQLLKENENQLKTSNLHIKHGTKAYISNNKKQLNDTPSKLTIRVKSLLKTHHNDLHLLDKTNELINPFNILKKGYSLTTINGKVLRDTSQVKEGDLITTHLSKGRVDSIVKASRKQKTKKG